MRELERGPIYRVVRLLKQGPLCPSVILWLRTAHEPGVPDNAMERSPHLAGFVSGDYADPERLYISGKAGSTRITRREYERLMGEIEANPYDPRRWPYRAVDLGRLAIPFAERLR